jgi:arsenate reductase
MHEVTIYHNPGCGTSRTTLGLIRTAGFEPEIIEYLKTPPDRAVLESLIERMHIKPRELLRAKESLYTDLGLADEGLSDDVLIDYMVANPILINRPIVVTRSGAKLCRPSESVLDILQPE